MAQPQTVRVIVEHKKPAGCGTFLLVLILIGLAIEYWYVALAILAVLVVIAVAVNSQKRAKELEEQRRRPGPRDPWLNEVAVALADLGLTEIARNTGGQLGGVPLEGDIGLQDDRLLVYVNLFSAAERARQAELGLTAKPEIRDAIARGATVLRADTRVLCVANGRGGIVDEFKLEEVIRTVSKVELPPPLEAPAPIRPARHAPAAATSAPQLSTASSDALEQIRKLGELRAAGVLTEAEFELKKAELLRRV